jgi:arsenate reductase-like glutaredoxin family protein
VKAREFLAHEVGEEGFALRNLIKEPLRAEEIRALAEKVGGPEELVAPKRRAEAEGIHGEKLIAWLAADGARLRRPIVVISKKKVSLGFNAAAQEQLKKAL